MRKKTIRKNILLFCEALRVGAVFDTDLEDLYIGNLWYMYQGMVVQCLLGLLTHSNHHHPIHSKRGCSARHNTHPQ